MSLRIVFMGTPEFAVPTLAEIVGAGHEVVAVYAQPPRAAGRGMTERKSPVQVFAEAAGIPVLTPVNFKADADRATFAQHAADAGVVVAYGLLLPAAVFEAPRLGCFNLHPSKLPRWRGAAPIQRALMAGDAETGVCAMQMDAGLDTGPVLACERLAIGPRMTVSDLHDGLVRIGAPLMVRAVHDFAAGKIVPQPQPAEGVTYAAKLARDEGRIDWSRGAAEIDRAVRALNPGPGTFFELNGERIKLLACMPADGSGEAGSLLDDAGTVACGTGALKLLRLQRPGKGPVDIDAFLRGYPLPRQTRLG